MKQLSEFRSNLREAFNDAEAGKPVYIERFGKVFELVHRPNYEHDEHGVKIVIPFTKKTPAPQLTPAIGIDVTPTPKKNNSEGKPSTFCPNGHFKGAGGKCLQKGCKYA